MKDLTFCGVYLMRAINHSSQRKVKASTLHPTGAHVNGVSKERVRYNALLPLHALRRALDSERLVCNQAQLVDAHLILNFK